MLVDRRAFDTRLLIALLTRSAWLGGACLTGQMFVFGAGHAFVKSTCITDLKFNVAYEFGFGEDNDFGMQLRNRGYDILYVSTSKILHLKAPIGGFRTKPTVLWQDDSIQPKPSPTVMLYKLLHDTKEQLLNYKVTLFFKNLNKLGHKYLAVAKKAYANKILPVLCADNANVPCCSGYRWEYS